MFSTVPRGSFLDEHISKGYSKEVLLSHWQELRQSNNEKSDGITPGLQRVNKCESHLTEQQENYIPPWKMDLADDATRHFRSSRIEAYNNLKRNGETQVRFPITEEMSKNFTTTYTIMYEILPKEFDGLPQELDMLQSYGNRSFTGKRCQQRQKMR